MNHDYTLDVNGIDYPISADTSRNLLSVIRSEVGLTGTKEGCDDCECGACMVLLDGQPINSCSYLAAQAAGRAVTTIEGMVDDDGELALLQRTLLEEGGVQCGFCTPGMVLSARALLDRTPNPTEDEIRIGLSGNLCRCTGYAKIVAAVARAAESTTEHQT
ncbi:MAG: (2Fe-2S)-binding protein [Acidimicrobiia bacterium]|nr:(2Fe-2S)-binding protein [Acidimicrobiia bacterium]